MIVFSFFSNFERNFTSGPKSRSFELTRVSFLKPVLSVSVRDV